MIQSIWKYRGVNQQPRLFTMKVFLIVGTFDLVFDAGPCHLTVVTWCHLRCRAFRQFFFDHFPIIESHIMELKMKIEEAFKAIRSHGRQEFIKVLMKVVLKLLLAPFFRWSKHAMRCSFCFRLLTHSHRNCAQFIVPEDYLNPCG